MKRFLSLITLLLVSVAVVPVADAKKFGGGRSFGSTFKTAPAPKQQYSNTNTLNGKAAQTQNTGRRGLLGGLMGGLLAGGLLAAFFGGAFEGIQFMDILIIGLVAYFIIRMLRGVLAAKQGSMNQQQPAFGSTTHRQSHVHNFEQPENPVGGSGFGTGAASDVPHRYPPEFDRTAFIDGAREHYRILQGAWNHNELETIREYVSASLFEDLKAEREKLTGEQHTDVMYVDAEFVRADYDANRAQLSLQFSGRYRDPVEGIEEEITDIWHLERDLTVPGAPWLIVGIQG
ncbi:Tim44 domain-containing protein [Vibrio mangrovi]|uniref:TIM44-like domain-containing protein n=1 Tax=Vibrio mangrovi TaxID=474394 RepID=A0A1Y6IS75_9VIBR|nr:TIM44-like domain-containing protein [Vibrio mangrovi]MDW6003558.1 TIM44-like domain-containing protein [Vibrio mangrovi]SMR99650.1 Tim44-like domain protein [Vibrio mangrovi]